MTALGLVAAGRSGGGIGGRGRTSWLRRLLGPDPELVAEIHDLSAQVDALATERDELAEALKRADQRAADLRAARKQAIRDAFEPVQVGNCTKLRYLHREDAEQHAMAIARKQSNEAFRVYRCGQCPRYPGFGTRPWHVGHCGFQAERAMWVDKDVLYHACGCTYDLRSEETVWSCDQHQAPGQPSIP